MLSIALLACWSLQPIAHSTTDCLTVTTVYMAAFHAVATCHHPLHVRCCAPQLPPAGSRRNTVQDALSGLAPPPPPSSSAAAAAAEFVLGGSSATSPEPGGGPPSRRVTGPQSWYAAAHGLPAEQLPKADVGPHLPPGGWRGSLPRAEDGSVLPSLVSRGGGAFGLGGSVPPGTAQGGRPAATG